MRSPINTSYPPLITQLRAAVCSFTIIFAVCHGLYLQGDTNFSPFFLLLSPTLSWNLLWQPISSALIIPYSGIGISMVFDLLILNFFLTPLLSFTLSFLNKKRFIRFLLYLIAVGTGTFCGTASIFHLPTPPSSLFGGLALSLIMFWFLLHTPGKPSFLIAIPISRYWILGIATGATCITPIVSGNIALILADLMMSLFSYVWGVCQWKLKSHIDFLEPIEHWLNSTYRTIIRFLEWRIFRLFRKK